MFNKLMLEIKIEEKKRTKKEYEKFTISMVRVLCTICVKSEKVQKWKQ